MSRRFCKRGSKRSGRSPTRCLAIASSNCSYRHERSAPRRAVVMCNQRLKCLQCLNRTFETNGSWLDVMPCSGLRNYGTDEVVSEDVSPHFFAYEFRGLASQELHLHGGFYGSHIEFIVPACTIQLPQFLCSRLLRIQKRCHYDQSSCFEAWLLDADPSFTNYHMIRK